MENNNKTSVILCILSFLIPILGWILYFVNKSDDEDAAKNYGLWGCIGFALNFFLLMWA